MQSFMDGLAGKRVVLSGCGGGCHVLGTSVIYQQIRGIAEKLAGALGLSFISLVVLRRYPKQALKYNP